MNFKSARQVLHDAFNIDEKTPNPMEARGTRQNNNAQIADRVEAGKVFAVVDKMSPLLKSWVRIVYARRSGKTDFERVYNYLWREMVKRHGNEDALLVFTKNRRLISLAVYAVQTEMHIEWNGNNPYHDALISKDLEMAPQNFRRDFGVVYDAMRDIIHELVPKSLGPVARLVELEKEKAEAA